MKKTVKAGILIAILVVPALSFLFLQIFAKNQFDIPYYFPEMDDNEEVVMVEGDTLFSKLQTFTLTNQEGVEYQYKPEKIIVVNFFFSRCGTICPIVNSHLANAAELFKDEPLVHFIGITVDPVHDTPDILKEYSKQLRIDQLNFDLLTGDKSYIYKQCIQNFHLPVADASEYDPDITNVDEMFIHSDKILLIDNNGFYRGIYTGTASEEIDRLKAEIKVLLNQIKG